MMEDQKEETPSGLARRIVKLDEETLDLIEQTRRAVAPLEEDQRFARAKSHLEDALKYRQPRIDQFDPSQHWVFRTAYAVQTNALWETVVQTLSFVYMYLLVFENGNTNWVYHYGSIVSLVVFWADLLLELLHFSRDTARKESKFPEIFYMKVGLLILLLAEVTMSEMGVANAAGRPINPLKVLRGRN
jgi:hypothetical protein